MKTKYVYHKKENLTPPEIFQELQKIEKVEQKSIDWHNLRKTLITASSAGSLLKKNQKIIEIYNKISSKKENVNEEECCDFFSSEHTWYSRKLNLEKFTGSEATRFGERYEDVACKFYEEMKGNQVFPFGTIIDSEYPFLGASPDGITENGTMLELKCLYSRPIIYGYIPLKYFIQIQIQLRCCNLLECDYLEIKLDEWRSFGLFLKESNPRDFRGIVIEEIGDNIGTTNRKFYFINRISNENLDLPEIERFLKEAEKWEFSSITFFSTVNYNLMSIKRNDDFFDCIIETLKEKYDFLLECQKDQKKLKKLEVSKFLD